MSRKGEKYSCNSALKMTSPRLSWTKCSHRCHLPAAVAHTCKVWSRRIQSSASLGYRVRPCLKPQITERERDRETDRHRETEEQRQRETERQHLLKKNHQNFTNQMKPVSQV